MNTKHPTPWRVAYTQKPGWHEKAEAHVVDANGGYICTTVQRVGHPGKFDEERNDMAHTIVDAVNAMASVETDQRLGD